MNSPVYQLLCQTLQNKIISDSKDKESTIFATDGANTNNNSKSNAAKVDPRIHQTNPEYSFTHDEKQHSKERLSNKSAINPTRNTATNSNSISKTVVNTNTSNNGIELKSKRSSVKNTPSSRQNIVYNKTRNHINANNLNQNLPLTFMKTFNTNAQMSSVNNHYVHKNQKMTPKGNNTRQNTNRNTVHHHANVISTSSKKSNLTTFTNNTLSSALTPNCNISYSTLKSTNSNSQSKNNKSRQCSLKTANANSRKTENSANNKFPINSNFLNLLKKKNMIEQQQINSNNSQN